MQQIVSEWSIFELGPRDMFEEIKDILSGMIDQTRSMLQKLEENHYPYKVVVAAKGSTYLNNDGSAQVLLTGIALGTATQTISMQSCSPASTLFTLIRNTFFFF